MQVVRLANDELLTMSLFRFHFLNNCSHHRDQARGRKGEHSCVLYMIKHKYTQIALDPYGSHAIFLVIYLSF